MRISRPIAAHRQVQDQKERFVKNPFPSRFKISAGAADVEIVVKVEADGVRGPLDGEDVKIVGETPLGGKRIARLDAGVGDGYSVVKRTLNGVRFLFDIFRMVRI